MASPDFSARLRYLNDSAHLLAKTAPATSKYLMSKCNSLMFDVNIEPSESHKRKACGSCGTIMILGWNGRLEGGPQQVRRRKSTLRRTATDRARTLVYKCQCCGRSTQFNISSSTSSRPKHKSISPLHTKHSSSITPTSHTSSLPVNLSSPQPASTPSGASTSSSSKKRTKARRQGGLEAILARQRATDSRGSGFGLDLLDFMKKS